MTAARAIINIVFVFMFFSVVFGFNFRCLCADGGFPGIHGQKTVESKDERPMSGSGHTAGVEIRSQISKAQCRA
jgi:hypothetical protein